MGLTSILENTRPTRARPLRAARTPAPATRPGHRDAEENAGREPRAARAAEPVLPPRRRPVQNARDRDADASTRPPTWLGHANGCGTTGGRPEPVSRITDRDRDCSGPRQAHGVDDRKGSHFDRAMSPRSPGAHRQPSTLHPAFSRPGPVLHPYRPRGLQVSEEKHVEKPTVLVTGNTYPVKDALRSLGGRWDPTAKGWRVPAAEAAQALALVAGAPKSSPRSSAPARRRNWQPCGYPGCNPNYCDECDGDGYVPAQRYR